MNNLDILRNNRNFSMSSLRFHIFWRNILAFINHVIVLSWRKSCRRLPRRDFQTRRRACRFRAYRSKIRRGIAGRRSGVCGRGWDTSPISARRLGIERNGGLSGRESFCAARAVPRDVQSRIPSSKELVEELGEKGRRGRRVCDVVQESDDTSLARTRSRGTSLRFLDMDVSGNN